MATKDIKVAYGIDVDAVRRRLGSYGDEDSVDDISRGLFVGRHWAACVEIAEDFARRQLRALH